MLVGVRAFVILEQRDREFIRGVDEALAEGARRSGQWLACRPGCAECCMGPFEITQLDALRLRTGLRELEIQDPERAARVRLRLGQAVERLKSAFPGDSNTGVLDDGSEAGELFAAFADDEPCPVLEPASQTCDLYSCRPMTCRVFGPPVRGAEGSIGVCELCFQGAAPEEIAACVVEADPEGREAALAGEAEEAAGVRGSTIVAFAFLPEGG
jgi:Fe-S-cluster containining protein